VGYERKEDREYSKHGAHNVEGRRLDVGHGLFLGLTGTSDNKLSCRLTSCEIRSIGRASNNNIDQAMYQNH
jgi:hypothetical protein